MASKKLIITLIAVALIFLALFSYLIFKLFPPTQQGLTPTPLPPLKITSIQPPQDPSVIYLPVQQIEIRFDQPIDTKSFIYEISPPTETQVFLKPETNNVIVIAAKPIWKPGLTTTIKVSPLTQSKSGSKLEIPVSYSINTDFPKNPDLGHE